MCLVGIVLGGPQKTYTPVNVPSVARFDEARARGKNLIGDHEPMRGAAVLKQNERGIKSRNGA